MSALDEVACIAFSRDRGLQLDGLLQSVRRHAPVLLEATTIIYRPTSVEFARAYDVLREAWPQVSWRPETDFAADIEDALGGLTFTVFHTDDDLYFADVDEFELDDETVCFSFRLGLNTTYCYPLDVEEDLSAVESRNGWISWLWREFPPGAFSYPLALNAHVFRTADVRRWLSHVSFENPNTLESALQACLGDVPRRMAAFARSRVVNVPANLVNDTFPNRHSGAYDTRELNELFLGGSRLDLDAMDFTQVHAAHEEIPYAFRRSSVQARA